MRILLGHNSTYYPSQGGGDKSNRLLMEALAARSHAVRVVTRVETFGPAAYEEFLFELNRRRIPPEIFHGGIIRAGVNGVDVRTLTLDPNIRAYFARQIEEFDPDVIVVSTDDPAHLLLEAALSAKRARVVYLVRATIAVPFGPDASTQSASKTERLRQVDGAVGVSQSVARYVREWGGVEAVHVPISLMEGGKQPVLGSFDNPFVTMVNPCAVKGISIFLALAERMPDVPFAAVPTWGTNEDDMAALRKHPNIEILPPAENVDEILRLTRVMLVPSVWAEARSRMVLESMSRAIPVIASNIGGLPEAKMGVDYLIPVNVVKHYNPVLDSRLVPVAEVPPQDIGPWEIALRRLLTDRSHYEDLARQSRDAALHYIGNLTVEPFEKYLLDVLAAPRRQRNASRTDQLSPEKRKLLAMRLREKKAGNPWFPRCTENPRVFCFPHAGAGSFTYRQWGPDYCPAVLPGREDRIAEPPFDRMEPLILAMQAGIAPLLDKPFAFFGHSMGAGIAFELARALRRSGLPSPRALFVSAARAPHLRTAAPAGPNPPDEDLIEELRRLGGLPESELVRLVLPALRADLHLYRNYVFHAEEPLGMPIFAYRGAEDPNLTRDHVEAWREETTGPFRYREFPGGHFYLHDVASGFLPVLREDQGEVMGDSRSDSVS